MDRLFDLPEYEEAFDRFVHTAIHESMRRKDVFLNRCRVKYSNEISVYQNTMASGEIVESRPIAYRMPLSIDFDEVIVGGSEKLFQAIDNAAEGGLKTLMPQIFDQLGKLSTAAGTTTDAKGQPFTWDLLLKSWEKMEIDFGKDGKPEISVIVGPGTHIPPPTEEEQKALHELLKRKRAEFDARQRRRKLSK